MAKPAHEVRIGLIKASLRRRQTRSGVRYTVSVVRLYRDGDVWKESARFGRDDLPVVRLVLDKVHTWILQRGCTKDSSRRPVTDRSTGKKQLG